MGVEEAARSHNVAIIFGVTGLVGKELARKLISESSTTIWKVYGVARKPDTTKNPIQHPNYHFISCDLLNLTETQEKLSILQDVSHIFWVTWASQFQLDTQECCHQNKSMLSNALNAILCIPNAAASLKHVSLQTGMKHYVSLQGPFDEKKSVCVYNEDCPRVVMGGLGCNFYYVLEDLLKDRLLQCGFKEVGWSVHRPGLIMGCSDRTLFNFMGSLCVYGAICKHLKLPFVFGGTRVCWEEIYIDGSDARLVADQHIWAATARKSGRGQAFNAINGTSFAWKEIWAAIGSKFGVDDMLFSDEFLFSAAMADKGDVWEEIVEKKGLAQTEMKDLANWEFLDALFRCPMKLLGTREKADRLGFTTTQHTLDSILYWIDCMRDEKLIP